MPSLGADMDVGTIVEWLVSPGDEVHRGQIIAVVDTAKAAIEIESFQDGVLQEILVDIGTQVPVGTPLALIGPAAGEGPEPAPIEAPAAASAAGPERAAARAAPPVRHLAQQLGVDLDSVVGSGPDGHITHDDVVAAASAAGGGAAPAAAGPGAASAPGAAPTQVPSPAPSTTRGAGRLRATPRARRLAAERGIDLDAVAGTGEHGAVLAADVPTEPPAATPSPAEPAAGAGAEAPGTPKPAATPTAATAPAAPSAPATRAADADRKAAMRTAIANLMSRSNAEIPHYYVTQTMDVSAALAWLRAHNAELPAARRVLPAALFLRATALAAQAVPDLNGHWVDGQLRRAEQVDLGVAVAQRGGGLVTPAIPDAGDLGIDELMARLADLVGRARRGKLRQAEMAGGSITVSNLGESGADALHGVIFPPQVALVGVGGIVERPWAVEGMLTVRSTATIVVAADHRASDGRSASAFLAAINKALAQPEEL